MVKLKETVESKTTNQLHGTNMNPDLLAFRPVCIPHWLSHHPWLQEIVLFWLVYASQYGDWTILSICVVVFEPRLKNFPRHITAVPSLKGRFHVCLQFTTSYNKLLPLTSPRILNYAPDWGYSSLQSLVISLYISHLSPRAPLIWIELVLLTLFWFVLNNHLLYICYVQCILLGISS